MLWIQVVGKGLSSSHWEHSRAVWIEGRVESQSKNYDVLQRDRKEEIESGQRPKRKNSQGESDKDNYIIIIILSLQKMVDCCHNYAIYFIFKWIFLTNLFIAQKFEKIFSLT